MTTIHDLVKKRDSLVSEIERVKGRLESAQEAKDAVDKECADRKVDPEKIDEVIRGLEEKYDEKVRDFQSDLEEAEAAIQPFVEEK